MISGSRIGFIDMKDHPDGDYQYVLVYLDCSKRTTALRPMTYNGADAVARVLLEIFVIFGEPLEIQYENDKVFVEDVCREISSLRNETAKIGPAIRHRLTRISLKIVTRTIRQMIAVWMLNNKTNAWSSGLKFVQLGWNVNEQFHPPVSVKSAIHWMIDRSTELPKQRLGGIMSTSETPVQYSKAYIGLNVKLYIPHADKPHDKMNVIRGVIISVAQNGKFFIGTTEGTLDRPFDFKEFTLYQTKMVTLNDVPQTKISLRDAARNMHIIQTGPQLDFCLCRKSCKTYRCKCHVSGKRCTSKCHNSLFCLNK